MSSSLRFQAGVLTMPVAIVVAGIFIAAAIYFSNTASRQGLALNSGTASASVAPSTAAVVPPAQPSIGNFRPIDPTKDHIRGSADAAVTLLQYSDLECPFCKTFHVTLQQIMKQYGKDVRWVFRHAPLAQLHSKAPAEANAVECAGEQGKFWELVDKIEEVTPANNGLDPADLPKLAQQVGVANIAQFQKCVDDNKYAQLVKDDLADAQTAGLRGTPYTVVIGPKGQKTSINGALPFDSVKATVESLIQTK